MNMKQFILFQQITQMNIKEKEITLGNVSSQLIVHIENDNRIIFNELILI
jgi:hypothetical protein